MILSFPRVTHTNDKYKRINILIMMMEIVFEILEIIFEQGSTLNSKRKLWKVLWI